MHARAKSDQANKYNVDIDNSKHGNLLYDRSLILVLQIIAAIVSEREKTRFGAERGADCVKRWLAFHLTFT